MCDVIRVNSRWVIRDNMKGLRQDDRLIGFLGETAAGRLPFHPNYEFLHDSDEQDPRRGGRHSREGNNPRSKGLKKCFGQCGHMDDMAISSVFSRGLHCSTADNSKPALPRHSWT
ncbi:hypothetical protein NW759_003580 [Fusarium solani]|nr:hypothetical protein NW759_003580 [Fusarium solani]